MKTLVAAMVVLLGSSPDGTAAAYVNGRKITFGRHEWTVQSGRADGVVLENGVLRTSARSGERPDFDGPNKLRAELAGVRRYAAGEPIRLQVEFRLSPDTVQRGLDWSSLIQLHQADMRYPDGSLVQAAPPFAIEVRSDGGRTAELVVSAPTETGLMRTVETDPSSSYWAKPRLLGRAGGVEIGAWHRLQLSIVDGNGSKGAIRVVLDDRVVCDFEGNVGYGYVDRLASTRVAGQAQATGAYLKIGSYAGVATGKALPSDARVDHEYRNLVVR